jgi:hypothetical protein
MELFSFKEFFIQGIFSFRKWKMLEVTLPTQNQAKWQWRYIIRARYALR